jgi:hypothetical protein
MGETKTLKVIVELEIRVDADDEGAIRDEIREAFREAMDDDAFEYTLEEVEE